MEQSPSWEANDRFSGQEVPRILWNPKIYYRIHKISPLVSFLSPMNSAHILTHFEPFILKTINKC
jgi:hypothetical protein